ncbi:response regulator receiver domain [Methylomonas sp. SURF-2]|uniref:Response regulator receiver domain n=1 Tax=Methylomonas subterranea TaxID=2952225 RepID=A0ABT1TBT7_9GAMM|nr:response regulator receiver domain [Methylomonas sp. SURF-2]MCQ8102925.1 response regulator receiver domain [Methylomonas sp. SURF-2]
MTTTDFQTRTKQNFLDFLNSALVVDEEASYPESKTTPKTTNKPTRGAGTVEKEENESAEDFASRTHKLFCGEIIEAFADKGIICGVFRPENKGGWTNQVVKAASNADIVILDWNLKVEDTETEINETADNAGDHAVNIIKQLAENDLKSGRIRMIAVYTAETKSDDELLNKIETGINGTASSTHPIDKNGNVMHVGPMTIAIIRKNGNNQDNSSSESGLPDRILDILANQHNGLLTNAAVAAVSAIRKNTFQLLNLFSNQMDAAFVAHRIGLPTPDEAEEHFRHVIVSDLQEILESADISYKLDADTMFSWAQDLHKRNALKNDFFETTFLEAEETLQFLLKSGLPEFDDNTPTDLNVRAVNFAGKNKKKKTQRLLNMTSQFINDTKHDEVESNRLWAKRALIRHHYGEPAPFLQPGTIIQTMRGGKQEYLICVQQGCDCRRVPSSGKAFIFLPAKPVSSDKINKGDVFLKLDNEWHEWQISTKGYEIQKILFRPSQANDVIKACKKGNIGWFFSGSDGREYKWLGALKSLYIQNVIHQLAQDISRIATIESEWYRK